MTDVSRVRISGPLASYARGFAAHLDNRGYAASSVVFHVRLLAKVSSWMEAHGFGVADLNRQGARSFLAERQAAGHLVRMGLGSLRPLLSYLRAVGVIEVADAQVPAAPLELTLTAYREYLARERGLAQASITRNVELARPFLAEVAGDGLDGLERLTAEVVITFVVAQSHRRPNTTQRLTGALRSLLRFLHVTGIIAVPLADAVPSAAARKPAVLPKALTAGQVAAILAACDSATAVGRRDLAVLTVLSRLGLRAGEVAALRLDQIDWRRGEISVTGKGNRTDRLPLPADVGEAIVAYVRDGRPRTERREVFLCATAPYRAMNRSTVSNSVASAARRAGLGTVYAHQLRHSAATAMLGAGASLGEIGQVLRHQHTATTAIYAKVDTAALRTVARRWPGSGMAA